jgi:hypothetical protein
MAWITALSQRSSISDQSALSNALSWCPSNSDAAGYALLHAAVGPSDTLRRSITPQQCVEASNRAGSDVGRVMAFEVLCRFIAQRSDALMLPSVTSAVTSVTSSLLRGCHGREAISGWNRALEAYGALFPATVEHFPMTVSSSQLMQCAFSVHPHSQRVMGRCALHHKGLASDIMRAFRWGKFPAAWKDAVATVSLTKVPSKGLVLEAALAATAAGNMAAASRLVSSLPSAAIPSGALHLKAKSAAPRGRAQSRWIHVVVQHPLSRVRALDSASFGLSWQVLRQGAGFALLEIRVDGNRPFKESDLVSEIGIVADRADVVALNIVSSRAGQGPVVDHANVKWDEHATNILVLLGWVSPA